MAQTTNRDTIKLLCKSILNRLENQKSVTFPPRLRQIIQDDLYNLVSPMVMTEQDLRDKAMAKVGAKAEMLQDTAFSESDQFKAAKAVVRSTFGDDELHGFYFQKPLKSFAEAMRVYLLRSSHIDDVFETDDDLDRQIVDLVKKFNAADMH